MSDAEGMLKQITKAIQNGDRKEIDAAIRRIWRDGYDHGFEDGYHKAKAKK